MALFSLDSNDLNTELNYKKCYINCMIVQIQDRNKDDLSIQIICHFQPPFQSQLFNV